MFARMYEYVGTCKHPELYCTSKHWQEPVKEAALVLQQLIKTHTTLVSYQGDEY